MLKAFIAGNNTRKKGRRKGRGGITKYNKILSLLYFDACVLNERAQMVWRLWWFKTMGGGWKHEDALSFVRNGK